MKKEYNNYQFENFVDDTDFIQWSLLKRSDLDIIFNEISAKSPEKKEAIEKAKLFIQSLDDKKISADQVKKIESWNSLYKTYKQTKRKTTYIRLFPYAAAIILAALITSMGYYYILKDNADHFITTYNRQDFTETKLILNNGQEINISEDKSEIIYQQNGAEIIINDQKLVLQEKKKGYAVNQLIVPFGKNSKVILSDGTVVWLNAGSRLSYPENFGNSNQRVVSLDGEGYFEVTRNTSKPFIVETRHSRIKVLGTSFNIKSYPDETIEETVLVKGSVSVGLIDSPARDAVVLEPNQCAIITGTNKKYAVFKVNAEDYISWIESIFIFHGEPLPSVLMRISRFYNIEIKWAPSVNLKRISGKLDLKEDYQKVLDALALITSGNYTEEDKVFYFKVAE